ncbi:MAG: hypothetical protein AAGC46_02465, partial [Solirubrobacteraceae bacterium]|nr:hypothetical protein [Patulibacter sp.]
GSTIQTVTPVGSGAFYTTISPFDPDDPTSLPTTEVWHTTGVDASASSATKLPVNFLPQTIVAAGGKTWFVETTDTGSRLWGSDGTVGGTGPVDFGGAGPTFIQSLAASGSTVAFTGDDRELWTWSGSGAPTKVTTQGAADPVGVELVGATGAGIFYRLGGTQLWLTTGTGNGTQLTSGYLDEIGDPLVTTVGSTTFFASRTADTGAELWSTTGTAGSTHRVADINTTPNGAGIRQTVTMGGRSYFWATDGALVAGSNAASVELWTSDGTTAGTTIVRHLNDDDPDATAGRLVATPHAVAAFTSRAIWWSDGSTAGTHVVHPTGATPGFFAMDPAAFGDRVVFTGPGATSDLGLWVTDGTDAGTHRIVDLPAPADDDGDYEPFYTAAGSQLYFVGWDAAHGVELWHSDGTAAGTAMVRDLAPGTKDVSMGASAAVGDHYVFAALDSAGIARVYATNAAGTDARQLTGTAYASLPTSIVPAGSSVWVTVANQLYRIDQTATVCPMVQAPQVITSVVPFGLGVAYVDLSGALSVSDGVGGASTLLHQFGAGSFGTLLPTSSGLWFAESDALTATGNELWHSDGSAAGTAIVGDLQPGPASSTPTLLAVAGSSLVWSADDGTHGTQLMGTPLGDPLATPAIAPLGCAPQQQTPAPTPTPTPQVVPTPTPTPLPIVKVTPKAFSAAVTHKSDRKAPYLYTFKGAVTLPAGAVAKTVCSGSVVVEIKRGKKRVAQKAVALTATGAACTYTVSVRLPKKAKLAKQGKLTATVRFAGSATLAAVKAKPLTLTYGH